MTFPRRQFLHLAAGAAALPMVSRIARAQTYPTRPVRVIVGFPASNASDLVARLAGQALSERLGQQFVIENRPGAGGNIGTEVVVNAQPDGYTLLSISPSATINATLYDNLSFNFIRDIAPVAGVALAPYVMVLNPSLPANTVPEFIAYARANPGKINMASAGIGSLSHMCGELFKGMAGVDWFTCPPKVLATYIEGRSVFDVRSPTTPQDTSPAAGQRGAALVSHATAIAFTGLAVPPARRRGASTNMNSRTPSFARSSS